MGPRLPEEEAVDNADGDPEERAYQAGGPELHDVAAEAPSPQKRPARHGLQAVELLRSWYLPAAHLSHVPCSASGCTVPGLHSVGVRLLVLQKEPSGHAVHWPLLLSPIALLYEPSRPAAALRHPQGKRSLLDTCRTLSRRYHG